MPNTPTQQTIVSLTPLSLDRDSRTLKIAASIKRLGYRSIVVENLASAKTKQAIPVETVTLTTPGKRKISSAQGHFKSRNTSQYSQWLSERIHFFVFLLAYFIVRPLQGLFQVPKASLFYLHEYRLFPMVYLLSKLHGTPYIYDAHDYYPLVFDENTLSPFWRKWFLPLLCWMEKQCIAHASGMITVNQGIVNLYRENYECEPAILRNSHDPRLDTDVPVDIRSALCLSPDDFLVVAVGHNKEGLAINNLIEAVRLSSERVHVAFIGTGFNSIIEILPNDDARERMHFLPPLPPTEIVPFIKGSDASAILYYAMTEDYEFSLPNKFFQSVAAEIPVLYPQLTEIAHIVSTYDLGILIDSKDTHSINTAIEMLMHDRCLRKKYADNAKTANAVLSWSNEEGLLDTIIKPLING